MKTKFVSIITKQPQDIILGIKMDDKSNKEVRHKLHEEYSDRCGRQLMLKKDEITNLVAKFESVCTPFGAHVEKLKMSITNTHEDDTDQ